MTARRIAVAMSGGVDSSVAALTLREAGEDIFGVMLRLWSIGPKSQNRCCSPRDLANARKIAADLDIPFYVLDVQSRFKEIVVDSFVDGYAKGITPNPCIACNRQIRFGFLLERSLAMGATHMATGHYARTESHNGGLRLLRAADRSKDQSYVLHVLNQEQLKKAIFPIGKLQKPRVREIARESGLIAADRSDSQDLCFLGGMDYRKFLREYADARMQPGPIVDPAGTVIGEHDGLAGYTIGQRKGIGIAAANPLYVISKDMEHNTLKVGPRTDLGSSKFHVGQLNWISGELPRPDSSLEVQIRYNAHPIPAHIYPLSDDRLEVDLSASAPGITPGQWAVFYADEACLGGGMILP